MGAVRLLAAWRLLGGDPVVPQREENDIKKVRGFPAGKRILAGCGIPFSFGRRAPAGRCEREPISPTGTLGLTDTMGTSGGFRRHGLRVLHREPQVPHRSPKQQRARSPQQFEDIGKSETPANVRRLRSFRKPRRFGQGSSEEHQP